MQQTPFSGQNTGMFGGYLFYLALKAINPCDLKADWLIRHDFVMANRTSSIPHDMSP